jgi:hypothetical protein
MAPADSPSNAGLPSAPPLDRSLPKVAVVGWLATLGVDLFLNAGLFAGVFFEPSPFLLAPEELFLRIPLGYLSFLVLAGVVTWLMARLSVTGWRAGARFGAVFGGLVHGGATLALASIATASVSLLAVWFVVQTVLTVVVGAVVGQCFVAASLRRLTLLVVVVDVVLVATTVALQSLGVVPTPL